MTSSDIGNSSLVVREESKSLMGHERQWNYMYQTNLIFRPGNPWKVNKSRIMKNAPNCNDGISHMYSHSQTEL